MSCHELLPLIVGNFGQRGPSGKPCRLKTAPLLAKTLGFCPPQQTTGDARRRQRRPMVESHGDNRFRGVAVTISGTSRVVLGTVIVQHNLARFTSTSDVCEAAIKEARRQN